MAAYATPTQLRAVLNPAGGPGTAGDLTDPVLAQTIADAQHEVDARLAARYTVPFDPVPALVVDVVLAVAAWRATLRYQRSVPLEERDPVALRYQWAQKTLTALATGTATLDDTGQGTAGVDAYNPYDGDLFDLDDLGVGHGRRVFDGRRIILR